MGNGKQRWPTIRRAIAGKRPTKKEREYDLYIKKETRKKQLQGAPKEG